MVLNDIKYYNIKHIILLPIIMVFLAMIFILTGCKDDLLYWEDIPDSEVQLTAEVIFRPLVPTRVETSTRAEAPEGSEYKGIKSLYVLFFDSDKQYLKEYSGYVDFTPVPSEGSTHEHVSFSKNIRAGRYYVYAVANISTGDQASFEKIRTIEELKSFKVKWDDEISDDLEMFGVFRQGGTGTIPDNESFETDALLTITPASSSIHSWVRRVVSKVTLDFNGENLKEGVTVHIKNATLKDVASEAFLGKSPSAAGANDISLIPTSDYSLTYGVSDNYSSWPYVSKTHAPSPSDVWGNQSVESFHDDNARALPCYENMQGEGKSKLQDSNGDGIIDSFDKDDMKNGTYLEVEGYYVANRPEYKSRGKIIYRFMLGKDAIKNFDLVRNHHYKITMRFKDYGNDVDWHIEYEEKYLDVTYPFDVNYQGQFFVPNEDYGEMHSSGHTFDNENDIIVTSFITDGTKNTWEAPTITQKYYNYNDQTGQWVADNSLNSENGWLTYTPGELSEDGTQKTYSFVAAMSKPTPVTINSLFPTNGLGAQNSPYNLSSGDGTLTKADNSANIENTANCYMVGAPGWYCFPLVYGNAITDSKDEKTAYSSTHIVNHLKNNIKNPYIRDNVSLSNISVKLIWQDTKDLITPSNISYDKNLFGGIGGIKFYIKGVEGNAVIALIDNSAKEDEFVNINRGDVYGTSGSTKAIWSWHIWSTRFGYDLEKDMRLVNHNEKEFDVMSVNLGWCVGNNKIKYYKRRKCDITFKFGEHEITRTIEQYPHILMPRGDHPYYQWGRKDPFVGTNECYANKTRWDGNGKEYNTEGKNNPPRLYEEPARFNNNKTRKNTIDCLDVLVKNPDKWHNAKRTLLVPGDESKGFRSINESYSDLWSNNGKKTVYDPCPAGYQVYDESPFTGFTTTGSRSDNGLYWNDVLETNIPSGFYTGTVNKQVIEFYTDSRKIQSIAFPVTGYRDYDARAEVLTYPSNISNGEGYVWYNTHKDATYSFHLKFFRDDLGSDGVWSTARGILAPNEESFYNTNGFAVRPVRTKLRETNNGTSSHQAQSLRSRKLINRR